MLPFAGFPFFLAIWLLLLIHIKRLMSFTESLCSQKAAVHVNINLYSCPTDPLLLLAVYPIFKCL